MGSILTRPVVRLCGAVLSETLCQSLSIQAQSGHLIMGRPAARPTFRGKNLVIERRLLSDRTEQVNKLRLNSLQCSLRDRGGNVWPLHCRRQNQFQLYSLIQQAPDHRYPRPSRRERDGNHWADD